MSEDENTGDQVNSEHKAVRTHEKWQAQGSRFKDAVAAAFKKLAMKEDTRSIETERPPVLFIDDKDKVSIMRGVAEKLGLKFEVVAKEGEEYSIDNGVDGPFSGPVPENKAFMRVSGQDAKGLTEFWQRVDSEEKAFPTKK